jgi:hypothetical protein
MRTITTKQPVKDSGKQNQDRTRSPLAVSEMR